MDVQINVVYCATGDDHPCDPNVLGEGFPFVSFVVGFLVLLDLLDGEDGEHSGGAVVVDDSEAAKHTTPASCYSGLEIARHPMFS